MKSSKSFLAAVAFLFACALQANAAHVDFNDPRRAVGREDNVRIDAQLLQETVTSGAPLNVTWQVENLGATAVAVADKIADVSYDAEERTITISIGAEVPDVASMPRLTVVSPGETKVFSTTGVFRVAIAGGRGRLSTVPQFVEIRVNVLRDITPFAPLLAQQARGGATAVRLPEALFDRWVESNAAIDLNALPVSWSGAANTSVAEATRPTGTY
jgi:hypothetical protein